MIEPRTHCTPEQQAELNAYYDAVDRQNGKPLSSGLSEAVVPGLAEVFRLYTPAELSEFPKPVWLVDPFVREHGLNILFGDTGVYKSFIAIDWAARAATSALYVSAEGAPSEFGERVSAWEHAAGRPSGILTLPEAVDLLDKSDVDKLMRTITSLDQKPGLLVVDTLSRNMSGNESATEDMSAFVRACDRLRAEAGCTILVLHHTGWDNQERERGAKALRAAADVSVRAKRANPLEARLECAKVRGTAEWDDRLVRLEPVDGSLVIATVSTPQEATEDDVRAYLAAHPTASQHEVEKNVPGRSERVRAAYRKVKAEQGRPGRPRDGQTPERGSSQGGRPIGTTLDDVPASTFEDGGW
jgi:AAA domain